MVDIVHRLLPLGESSYWLTKVELLQTLSCLDYTILHLYDKTLPEKILNHMVFKLVGDSDYRYRPYIYINIGCLSTVVKYYLL